MRVKKDSLKNFFNLLYIYHFLFEPLTGWSKIILRIYYSIPRQFSPPSPTSSYSSNGDFFKAHQTSFILAYCREPYITLVAMKQQ